MAPQTQGLLLLLERPCNSMLHGGAKLGSWSNIKSLGEAVAVPFAAQFALSAANTAQAISPPSSTPATVQDGYSMQGFTELKSIASTYHPANLLKMLLKNLGIQFLVQFNHYMVELIDHEKQTIEADELGEEPPPPPVMPDLTPIAFSGLVTFVREVLVTTTRRIYEHIACWKLPRHRAESLLRDSKAWIRDVLAPKHQNAPVSTKLLKYQFAVLHASALFYAADCTVAIGFHTYRTVKRADKTAVQKGVHIAKGVGLQIIRCFVTMIAGSLGAAVGSLVKPGLGTFVGHTATDIAVGISFGVVVSSMLD